MKINTHIHPFTRVLKRVFDIISSLVGLLVFIPIFPIIALLIKLDSPGPIVFRQLRIGTAWHSHTELFYMLKFRSMRMDAESKTGAKWATKDDPRITRIGKLLRKSRLDELPQLINVLVGEMSLIGPRPERPGFYQTLETAIPFYAERTYGVTPGITGFAQVNQGYDENLNDVRAKLAYDHAYALCLSNPFQWFLNDIHIAMKTVVVMVMGRGQ